MRVRLYLPLIIAMIEAATAVALSQEIQRLDPSVDQLVPANAVLEKVATGFNKWTEGPVWTRNGTLLFAEIPANNIDQWIPGQSATVFMHPSGYKGAEPFNGPEPGSNGMTLDPDGRVSVAGHAGRTVWRLESVDPHAQVTVLADSYQGKKLSSPNDLVYKSDGSLYFTDPPYGLPTQSDNDPAKELQVNGVYRAPGARSVFLDPSSDPAKGVPDGLRLDKNGNIYSSGPGGVWIISPEGKHLGTVKVPEVVSNVAWGDADGKTLYITGSTSVYRIKLSVQGDRKH